jgi:cell division transport system ATP-binding protein
VIEFEQAAFAYGRAEVLHDLSLTLDQGSFTLLVGASGSGKTTLLRLCYMDLVPTRGRIRFFGAGIRRDDRDAIAALRRRIGVVHRDGQFLDHLPLIDNIALPLRVAGIDLAERQEDLAALLEWVGLTHRLEVLPPALSAGERRRAGLARALILSPEMVLADEPTADVERDMALRLTTLLVELNRMGKTVVAATGDPDLIRVAGAQAGARVLRLDAGLVAATEPVA